MTPFISNHVELALDRLFNQYSNSPNIRGILSSIAEEIQDIENDQYTLYLRWYIELLSGIQLDNIGGQVGLSRSGLIDSDYRVRLRTKIAINTSKGDIECMYKFLRTMAAGRPGVLRISDNYPAAFQVMIGIDFTENELLFIKESMYAIKGIGIGITSVAQEPTNAFRFDIGDGFSSVDNPTNGGKLAKTI